MFLFLIFYRHVIFHYFPVNQSYHFVPNKVSDNHNSSVTLLYLSDSCMVLITATDDDMRILLILIVL